MQDSRSPATLYSRATFLRNTLLPALETQFKAKPRAQTYIEAFKQWDRGMMTWFPGIVLEDEAVWSIVSVYVQFIELLFRNRDVDVEELIEVVPAEGKGADSRGNGLRFVEGLSAKTMGTQIHSFKTQDRLEELASRGRDTLHRLRVQGVLDKFPQQGRHVVRYVLDFFELTPKKLDDTPVVYRAISRQDLTQVPPTASPRQGRGRK